jgi:hypothetical protein
LSKNLDRVDYIEIFFIFFLYFFGINNNNSPLRNYIPRQIPMYLVGGAIKRKAKEVMVRVSILETLENKP